MVKIGLLHFLIVIHCHICHIYCKGILIYYTCTYMFKRLVHLGKCAGQQISFPDCVLNLGDYVAVWSQLQWIYSDMLNRALKVWNIGLLCYVRTGSGVDIRKHIVVKITEKILTLVATLECHALNLILMFSYSFIPVKRL